MKDHDGDMVKIIIQAVVITLTVFIGTVVSADSGKPIIREERKVVIDGVEEIWRLEWAGAPSPVCGPDDEEWYTCPCTGFAFGEQGDLNLVRERKGSKQDRLSLTQLFQKIGSDMAPGINDNNQAILRRWNVDETDMEHMGSTSFASRVKSRQLAQIMELADYDHDGRATELYYR